MAGSRLFAFLAGMAVLVTAYLLQRNWARRQIRRIVSGGFGRNRFRTYRLWQPAALVTSCALAGAALALPGLRTEAGAGALLVGSLLAGQVLRARGRAVHRERLLVADLPRLMELIAVCVQGGLSLEAALLEGARRHNGEAGQWLRGILEPVEAGGSVAAVLRSAAQETKSPESRAVCRTLSAALMLGVPAAGTLTELSEFITRRRRRALEERIRTLPLRLTLIALFLLLPPVVVLVVLPNVAAFFQSPW